MAKYAGTSASSNAEAALARMQARLAGLSGADIAKADKRAISSVRRRFEPVTKQVIRLHYKVRLGDLGGKFQVRSGQVGGYESLSLHASTRKLPLERFGAKWGGRKTLGATAQIRDTRETYESAFIRVIQGRREVLARQFSADSNSPSGRDPRNKLRRLRGPSPWQMTMGLGDENAREIALQVNEFRGSETLRQLALLRKGKL